MPSTAPNAAFPLDDMRLEGRPLYIFPCQNWWQSASR